jgi:hypothetical protein
MQIVQTVYNAEPLKMAQYISIVLAGDRGIPNELKKICGGYLVIADDGKAVRVLQENLRELIQDEPQHQEA